MEATPSDTGAGDDEDAVVIGGVPVRIVPTGVVVGDVAVELTEREREVLSVLARRPGVVVDKATLLREVWADATDAHTVEVTVSRLRQRLAGLLVVRTVARRGYRLAASFCAM